MTESLDTPQKQKQNQIKSLLKESKYAKPKLHQKRKYKSANYKSSPTSQRISKTKGKNNPQFNTAQEKQIQLP